MWIRDTLPKHLLGVRAVIYGYDTKLKSSQSFQLIPDLAKALIDQLQAHGWDTPSAKPVVFLVHSLGGLLLREAITQLDNSSNEEYKSLLSVLRGAVFFGVPNLGMEQSHFRTVVHNNPNEALVDDISRNSNYLRRLNELFPRSSFQSRLKCFWAYETSESPTIQVSQPSQ
jgi:alpha-beta hydrolase superfamily lysophospholipase